MRNHSYEDDFDLHENETACRTHFHMKGFALGFALKQRHKRTQPRSQGVFPGLRAGRSQGKGPGNEVEENSEIAY